MGGGSNPGPGPAARWTWTRQSQPTTGPPSDGTWISIASSSDGSSLAVSSRSTTTYYNIWTAVRSGSSWTWTDQTARLYTAGVSTTANWTSIASSADGLVLAACGTLAVEGAWVGVFSSGLWTWEQVNSVGNIYTWSSIAISADGKRMATCEASGTYGGYTAEYTGSFPTGSWSLPIQFPTSIMRTTSWSSICSDSTGTKLGIISTSAQLVYTGVLVGSTWTWTDSSPTTAQSWSSIASSTNGNRLALCSNGGSSSSGIWIGAFSSGSWSWAEINAPPGAIAFTWTSVSLSADGTRIVICDGGSSFDSYTGVEGSGGVWAWTQQSSGPQLIGGASAACSSADGLSIATCDSSGSYGVYTGVYA